jgi:hypothetical protein
MADIRKNVKVHPGIKFDLSVVKKHNGFKTESEAISYLLELYDIKRPFLTFKEHESIKEAVENIHRQGVF